MFLHSGASLHGHEYSNRRASTSPHHVKRRSPLLRSAFSNPRPTTAQTDGFVLQPPQTTLGASDHASRTSEHVVRFLEPDDAAHHRDGQDQKEEVVGNANDRKLEEEDNANLEDDDENERGQEQEIARPSADEVFRQSQASEFSDDSQSPEVALSTSGRPRRTPVPRKATRYLLAYPAPSFVGKTLVVHKVLPKLYLQLQEISADKRPKPVIDVFPGSRIAGSIIAPRLAKRFPRAFGVRGELGFGDVVLMRSEDYDAHPEPVEGTGEDAELGQGKLLAVFRAMRRAEMNEIVLEDGSVWIARQLPTGSFDFTHTDAFGNVRTARWVRRSTARSREDASKVAGAPSAPPQVKYTFSLINPLSRRHPIMATMSGSALDIQSHYTAVSHSSARYPPSASLRRSSSVNVASTRRQTYSGPAPNPQSSQYSGSFSDNEGDLDRASSPRETQRTLEVVDEATKLLISVTAVWLALRLGWSPSFKAPAALTVDRVSAPGPSAVSTNPNSTATVVRNICRGSRRRNSSEVSVSTPRTAVDSRPSSIIEPADGITSIGKTSLRSPGVFSLARSRDSSPGPPPQPRSSRLVPQRGVSGITTTSLGYGSESGESETLSNSARPNRAKSIGRRRIFSGDWSPGLIRSGSRRNSFRDRVSSNNVSTGIDSLGVYQPEKPPACTAYKGEVDTAPRPDRTRIPACPWTGERRVQSAYYPRSQVKVNECEVVHGTVDHDWVSSSELTQEHYTPAAVPALDRVYDLKWPKEAEDDGRKSRGARLRDLGAWFRKLGTH
ncbi:hypothetical protein VTK73DRAFT_5389 [Phialemonium thermophilum]|uniref:Uncharacterized protein n=1 Tax=Phialemonium thermophilum TaxID=223376 RepID=A0ABR3XX63_9PEZI